MTWEPTAPLPPIIKNALPASTWPPPRALKVGDMVIVASSPVNQAPGLVIEVKADSAFPYRVGGDFGWGWFPAWQVRLDPEAQR
jgi:hypothetical protein